MKLAITCVALMLAGSSPAFASNSVAPAGPVAFEDVVGDANMLNSQNAEVPEVGPGTATPGSQPGLDIVKVELRNTFARAGKGAKAGACTGFQMVMTLSGPPADNAFFDMTATSTRNNRLGLVISYESRTKETRIRYGGDKKYGKRQLKLAEVRGNTITWTVSSEDLEQMREKRGSKLALKRASTSLSPDGWKMGFFDKAAADKKTFIVCK